MDIVKCFMDDEDAGGRSFLDGGWYFPGLPTIEGRRPHESLDLLVSAYATVISLHNVGWAAVRICGRDIPDDIGQAIKSVFGNLRGTVKSYNAGAIEAAAAGAAVEEGRAKAAKIGKALKALKK
jgi:hypothetical protein